MRWVFVVHMQRTLFVIATFDHTIALVSPEAQEAEGDGTLPRVGRSCRVTFV